MQRTIAILAASTGLALSAHARPGPDVYVGDLWNMTIYGPVGPITAYAVGTNACNLGTAPVDWYGNTPAHPTINQNMYRLMNGRFEQIGQSWGKHGFGSENGNFCATCIIPPGGFSQLGLGCSDAYDAGTNGFQSIMGPRSQVNGTTGIFPYPFNAPPATTAIDRRLQVLTTDITPALNPGALYFVEGHYITADDAAANNGLNNATYRQVTIASAAALPVLVGPSHVFSPAIQAWQEQDPSVILAPADYADSAITARFWVAAKATDNGNGTWHYEYAVHNLNADRAGGSFSVPVPGSANITNIGFHAPFSHSGEPYDNSPWTAAVGPSAITFSPPAAVPEANTNAIRWGTLYNFRFDADLPPSIGAATIGLFVAGPSSSVAAVGIPVPAQLCYPNCDGSTAIPVLTVSDFSCFLNRYAAADSYANCDNSTGSPQLNIADFACFLNAFATGCP